MPEGIHTMNGILALLGYLRDRMAEPGSQRALALAFGLAGITVTSLDWQIALAVLTLLTTAAAVFLREKATVTAAGSTSPISAIAFNTLMDLLGQGPAVQGVAQQVYALHADGKLDANELLSILGGLNTVASGVAAAQPPGISGQLIPASPAPAPAPLPLPSQQAAALGAGSQLIPAEPAALSV